jgi:hypothetical protein
VGQGNAWRAQQRQQQGDATDRGDMSKMY